MSLTRELASQTEKVILAIGHSSIYKLMHALEVKAWEKI